VWPRATAIPQANTWRGCQRHDRTVPRRRLTQLRGAFPRRREGACVALSAANEDVTEETARTSSRIVTWWQSAQFINALVDLTGEIAKLLFTTGPEVMRVRLMCVLSQWAFTAATSCSRCALKLPPNGLVQTYCATLSTSASRSREKGACKGSGWSGTPGVRA
jgi:hypothetical protein